MLAGHRLSRLDILSLLALAATLWCVGVGRAAGDAVLEAKRKGAAQLLKDGKAAEAMQLLGEVLAADDGNYADHLLAARADEALAQPADAVSQYRRVVELVGASPRESDRRAARQESERRLKVLDPLGEQIAAVADDFARKLDGLEREAIAARSMSALAEVFRLRGNLWQALRLKDRAYAEVKATDSWVDSGLDVVAGRSYRVRAAGTWRVLGLKGQHVECTAAGSSGPGAREPISWGRIGQLSAQVTAGGRHYELGEDVTFTPSESGRLTLICNEGGHADRAGNSGAMSVLVEPGAR